MHGPDDQDEYVPSWVREAREYARKQEREREESDEENRKTLERSPNMGTTYGRYWITRNW